MPPTTLVLFYQGNSVGTPVAFGDGLRCVSGTLIRLATRTSSGGASTIGYGVPGDPSVSSLGSVPAGGRTLYYDVLYRNSAAYCTSGNENMTNAIRVTWFP